MLFSKDWMESRSSKVESGAKKEGKNRYVNRRGEEKNISHVQLVFVDHEVETRE